MPGGCFGAIELIGCSVNSGIFGYVNYLVEKDRKYILETLVQGLLPRHSTSWVLYPAQPDM